jgi:sodium transport system permease protein
MTWKNVKLIFLRELRDQLRDRRTLFMVAVLPLMLYPALGVGMTGMMANYSEQERTVAIVGAADLPPPPLLDPNRPDRFLAEYFDNGNEVDMVRVITEATLNQPHDKSIPVELQERQRIFLKQAIENRGLLEQLGSLSRSRRAAEDRAMRLSSQGPEMRAQHEAAKAEAKSFEKQEIDLRLRVNEWFMQSPVEVLVIIPTGFAKQIEETNRQLANRENSTASDALPRPVILQNSADEKSQAASRRIRDAMTHWEERLREARLLQAGLPSSLSSPVDPTNIELAAKEDMSANLWSKLFPALLVMMGVTGAFYPAIDLGAGEKERGTMETLLICPARRSEIVMGKFLTVMIFSICTALLNMVSMGFTSKHMLSVTGGRSGMLGDVTFPPVSSLMWVLAIAIPLCALFSATSLAVAMFARSNKEGQYYLTPLLMVTMGLTVFCLMPSNQIEPYYSVLPIAGPALLLKALLSGGAAFKTYGVYLAPVIISSIFYSVVALNWAISLFDQEEVLFREAERFDLGLWLKHVLREKEPVPSRTEAALCFAMILLTQFAVMSSLQSYILKIQNETTRHAQLLLAQTIYLIGTVGAPPLLMAILLTSSFRRTLKLYWPKWQYLVLGIVLPIALQPITIELLHQLEWFFPKPPAGMADMMKSFSDKSVPWWMPFLAVAVTPAICEELAFRGFILSGLQSGRQRNFWTPILISAVCFGVVHMIAHQVFNAILLGLVIGLLAVRSRSLLPGVIFHLIFNGMQVLQSRVPTEWFQSPTMDWLFSAESEAGISVVRFDAPLLAISGLLSVGLVTWLIKSPMDGSSEGPQRRFSDLDAEATATQEAEDQTRWDHLRQELKG